MFALLIKRFNKSPFYKSVAWVAGGTAAAQAITMLSAPVVTRLYTPSDYGILALFVAILGIMAPFSSLTYATAIPLAEDETLTHDLLMLCFLITLTISLFLGIIVFLFGSLVAMAFSVPDVASYLWLLPLCLLGTGLYEALSRWAIRRKYFKTIAMTGLSRGASGAGIKIGLGWLGIQPLGLLLGLLASSVAGCSSITRKLIKEDQAFGHFSWRGMSYAAKRFSQFPLFRSWSRLLLGFNKQISVFFMAGLFGVEVAGLFGLANSMVNLPMGLLGESVATVFFGEIAGYGKSRPDKIRALAMSVIKKTSLVGTITMVPILIAGPWLFSVVFGAEWAEAGVYARLLAISVVIRFASKPVQTCLVVFEMVGTQLLLNVIHLSLIAAAFMVSELCGLSPHGTVGVYSIAIAVNSSITFVLVHITLKRRANSIGGAIPHRPS